MQANIHRIERKQSPGNGLEPPMDAGVAEEVGTDKSTVPHGPRVKQRSKSGTGGRHALVLEFIRDFVARNPYPPTIREIGAGCGISSTSVVDYHLSLLEAEGYLTRIPSVARGIALTGRGRFESETHQAR